MKKVQISATGKELLNQKDRFDLAFVKIKDLILASSSYGPFRDNNGLLMYQKLVMGTVRQKDPDVKRDQVLRHVEPYNKLFAAYREEILQEDLTWLGGKEEIEVMTGKSATAKLPLSKVYLWCIKNDDDKTATVEACLYQIFRNLVHPEQDAETYKILDRICGEYETTDPVVADSGKAVKSLVENVRANIKPGADGSMPSVEQIAGVVKGLFSGGEGVEGINGMVQNLMNGQLTIPQLMGQVKSAVESGGPPTGADESKGKEEVD